MIPALQEIIDIFEDAEGQEKLELMLEYGQEFPTLPADITRNDMEKVDECIAQFFLTSRLIDGKIYFYFDTQIEAATIRGFAAILSQSINGETPQTILALPDDLPALLGMPGILSQQRLFGMRAVWNRVKNHAQKYLNDHQQA